ncbi:MAG TPA: hypothetical protein DIT04_13035, partial [Dysgonomonas sp.]|nr:hypothetical protein [Dysgonomonas sp.]
VSDKDSISLTWALSSIPGLYFIHILDTGNNPEYYILTFQKTDKQLYINQLPYLIKLILLNINNLTFSRNSRQEQRYCF